MEHVGRAAGPAGESRGRAATTAQTFLKSFEACMEIAESHSSFGEWQDFAGRAEAQLGAAEQ